MDLRPHWRFLAGPAAFTIGAAAGAIAVIVVFPHAPIALAWLLGLAVAVPFLWLAGRIAQWATTNLIVTTGRLLLRRGVLARSVTQIRLDRIAEVHCRQGLFERIIGTGTIAVEVFGEEGLTVVTDVRHPRSFQRVLSEELARTATASPAPASTTAIPPAPPVAVPSPPVYQPSPVAHPSPVTIAPEPYDAQRTPARGVPVVRPLGFDQPPTPGHRRTEAPVTTPLLPVSASIPDQLVQLEELRRRGIITDDEFAAKKAELLSRFLRSGIGPGGPGVPWAGARRPLSLHRLREPDPVRRHGHPHHPGVPSLHGGGRSRSRRGPGAVRVGRRGLLPLVRTRIVGRRGHRRPGPRRRWGSGQGRPAGRDLGQPVSPDRRSSPPFDPSTLSGLVAIPTYRNHPATPVSDVWGTTPAGSPAEVTLRGGRGPTLLLFLSSSCRGCEELWIGADALGAELAGRCGVVVLTRGPEAEKLEAVRRLAPATVPVVVSSDAFGQYRVGGAPFFVLVDRGVVTDEGVVVGVSQVVAQVTARVAQAAAED